MSTKKVQCPFCKRMRPFYLIKSHTEQCKAEYTARKMQKEKVGR